MRESDAILMAYDDLKKQGRSCVLATVVHVEGSSYRRAGARMLVAENGMMTGAISGGCLEGDALKKALLALLRRENKLVTYDTNDEEDAVVGAQLGCNGVIQVLFQPLPNDNTPNPFELLREASAADDNRVMVTLFHLQKDKVQPGAVAVFDPEMNLLQGSMAHHTALLDAVSLAFRENTSLLEEYELDGEPVRAFIEVFQPAPHLVLVGAGNDAQAPAGMAAMLGWKVSIVDGRPTHANNRRFGDDCRVIVTRPEQLLDKIQADSRTAFVLMTHNYQYDLAVLRLLACRPEIPYIGILGPRKKYLRMLDELAAAGIRLTPDEKARIHAPVGLDLGAENAAEIGLSILSEILAVFNARAGGRLRERNGPIHGPAIGVLQ